MNKVSTKPGRQSHQINFQNVTQWIGERVHVKKTLLICLYFAVHNKLI